MPSSGQQTSGLRRWPRNCARRSWFVTGWRGWTNSWALTPKATTCGRAWRTSMWIGRSRVWKKTSETSGTAYNTLAAAEDDTGLGFTGGHVRVLQHVASFHALG